MKLPTMNKKGLGGGMATGLGIITLGVLLIVGALLIVRVEQEIPLNESDPDDAEAVSSVDNTVNIAFAAFALLGVGMIVAGAVFILNMLR